MRLSDFKGDEAFEVIADILDPITEICADNKVVELFKTSGVKITAIVKAIVKNHAKAVKTIFAVLDRKDPDEYEPSLLEIPKKLLELLNDPDFMSIFGLQRATGGAKSSTSASESITASEE